MAKLLLNLGEGGVRELELRIGRNTFGRSERNDFPLDHPTIDEFHCEILLENEELPAKLTDLGSACGTFIDGDRVGGQATLQTGQRLEIGVASMDYESKAPRILVPKARKYTQPFVEPSPVFDDGSPRCCNNDEVATLLCSQCGRYRCPRCVRRLKRQGSSRIYLFCGICGGRCHPIEGDKRSVYEKVLNFIGIPTIKR